MAQQKKTGRHASAKKEVRKSGKRRLLNRKILVNIKSLNKQLDSFCVKKDVVKAKEILSKLFSVLDKASKNNIIHKKTASRKKSRLTLKVNKIK